MSDLKHHPAFKHLFEGPDALFEGNAINTSYQDIYDLAKPSPLAFEAAIKKYNEDPEYSLFIDDTREKLFDWRNKKIQEKHPECNRFWACSFLYSAEKHELLVHALIKLGVLTS